VAKTYKQLWEKVFSLSNLMQAANLAMRGKRSLVPVAGFFAEWELVGKIIASHHDGIRREYGEDLFAFTDHPRGLLIGNLTSQFFANIHLDRFGTVFG
jgi:hypothetical protein